MLCFNRIFESDYPTGSKWLEAPTTGNYSQSPLPVPCARANARTLWSTSVITHRDIYLGFQAENIMDNLTPFNRFLVL